MGNLHHIKEILAKQTLQLPQPQTSVMARRTLAPIEELEQVPCSVLSLAAPTSLEEQVLRIFYPVQSLKDV